MNIFANFFHKRPRSKDYVEQWRIPETWVCGHVRPLIITPFDRSHTSCYSSSIVVMASWCTVSENKQDISQKLQFVYTITSYRKWLRIFCTIFSQMSRHTDRRTDRRKSDLNSEEYYVMLNKKNTICICSPNMFHPCSFHQWSEVIFVCSVNVRCAVIKISLYHNWNDITQHG